MKVILIVCSIMLTTKLYAKRTFDVEAASEGRDQLIEKLKEAHRAHYLKSFEHELRNNQKLLKLQLKFMDDLAYKLSSMPLEDKRDFSKLFKEHQKMIKEFEKTAKRRQKFFEKDMTKPQKKVYQKDIKEIVQDFKQQARGWTKQSTP